MRVLAVIPFFLFLSSPAPAQQRISLEDQKKFAHHLFESHLYDECILVIRDCYGDPTLDAAAKDSLQELQAECFLRLQQYDSAATHYSSVTGGPGKQRSRFLSCYSFGMSGNFLGAEDCLPTIVPGDTVQNELDYYFGRCLSLLQGRKLFRQVDAHVLRPQTPFFMYKTGELRSYELQLRKMEHKSMFLAGLMSAVVPGTGKIYAGKWRSGLTSFVPIAVMGLEAWEAYKKDGWKSARFAVFGSLFGVFYIGNIWGSALSVSVHRREIENEVHHEILLGMHISLQHVFGAGR
jgi:hypothetical protein